MRMITRLQYQYTDDNVIPDKTSTNYIYNIRISESEAKDIVFEMEAEIRDLIKDIILDKYAIPKALTKI